MAVVSPAAGPLSARRPAAGAAALRVLPETSVLVLACALRLVALGRVPTNPYYDAAVRSMGTSWAAFLAGAFEPGRRVGVDKPPGGLWLALAVLPSAVIVARSDTMDAVMAALATTGVALVVKAARSGRVAPLLGAGALLGLAFDVKLTEALVAVAAAGVLWLAAGPR